MHYKNGREAKNGDKVVLVPSYGAPVIGILYDATAGNDYCNGRIAPVSPSDPMPNLKECLHWDDVVKALTPPPPDPHEPRDHLFPLHQPDLEELPAEVPDTSKA
ncbi:MAG TPA: hypothetical protein VIU86_19995 [Gaiellaceae bacterium]